MILATVLQVDTFARPIQDTLRARLESEMQGEESGPADLAAELDVGECLLGAHEGIELGLDPGVEEGVRQRVELSDRQIGVADVEVGRLVALGQVRDVANEGIRWAHAVLTLIREDLGEVAEAAARPVASRGGRDRQNVVRSRIGEDRRAPLERL